MEACGGESSEGIFSEGIFGEARSLGEIYHSEKLGVKKRSGDLTILKIEFLEA